MKKKILCIALLASTMSMNAFAADVSVVGNKVTVGVDSEAAKWGTLIVTKSGDTLDDENIIAMKQALADEEGNMTFNFSMPDGDSVNGKYDLHIKNGDNDIVVESMYYAIPGDRENVMNALRSSDDITTVLSNDDNEIILEALGISVDSYNSLVETGDTESIESVNEMFVNQRSEDMSDEDIASLLNTILVVQYINAATEISEEDIERFGYSFEGVKYKYATDSVRSYVCEYIVANKPYATPEDIQAAYEEANMLAAINEARYDMIEGKITGYASALGIAGETEYIKYVAASNKTAINEDIVAALKKNKAMSVEELLATIDTATKANPVNVNGGGVSSSTFGNTSNSLATVPVVSGNAEFKDINEVSWAKTAISSLAAKGIVSGDENGYFNPNNAVTREEFVKMLVVAAGVHNTGARSSFEDVANDAWYSTYVASAYNNKMVYGISDSIFGVGSNITRQDMAVMCYRAAENRNELNKVREGVQFADEANISDYAKSAVSDLYEAGIINGVGDNLFNPTGTATRAEAAVMIYNLFVK